MTVGSTTGWRDLRVPKESGCQLGGIGTMTLGTIRRYHAHSCALRHRVPVRVPCQSIWHPDCHWSRSWTPGSVWCPCRPHHLRVELLAAKSCTKTAEEVSGVAVSPYSFDPLSLSNLPPAPTEPGLFQQSPRSFSDLRQRASTWYRALRPTSRAALAWKVS
jgi:hypothetical protein